MKINNQINLSFLVKLNVVLRWKIRGYIIRKRIKRTADQQKVMSEMRRTSSFQNRLAVSTTILKDHRHDCPSNILCIFQWIDLNRNYNFSFKNSSSHLLKISQVSWLFTSLQTDSRDFIFQQDGAFINEKMPHGWTGRKAAQEIDFSLTPRSLGWAIHYPGRLI